MTTPITYTELTQIDDEKFISYVSNHPTAEGYESAAAYAYASLRAARLFGIVIRPDLIHRVKKCEG